MTSYNLQSSPTMNRVSDSAMHQSPGRIISMEEGKRGAVISFHNINYEVKVGDPKKKFCGSMTKEILSDVRLGLETCKVNLYNYYL